MNSTESKINYHAQNHLSGEIKIIKKSSKEYPEILKEISNAPKQFYARGKLPKNNDLNFAIVGTRSATEYGKILAFKIAKELSELGFTIISGLALGIDTQAHLGALAARQGGGKTIAVLGSGIADDSIYPRENLNLAQRIIASGGAVISEYDPKEKSEIWYFPERNRIISGMSRGVLVVEAPDKSGALITAGLALEQNREVFSIPGSVFQKNSLGTNKLIKDGAKMVTSIDDILEELNLTDLKLKTVEMLEKNLSREEAKILKIIEKEPIHIDKICEIAKMTASKVLPVISMLEIKSMVKNIGGRFVKI